VVGWVKCAAALAFTFCTTVILSDKSTNGGNVLTRAVLANLPKFEGPKVIYSAGCLLGRERLQRDNVVVRQTPYEIRVS
jgi:adenine-specific DNA-methyltransferase